MSDPTAIQLDVDPREQRMAGVTYHGDKAFDVPYMTQITDTLWTGGCANGLLLPPEIMHVVSLYPWESYRLGEDVRSYLQVRMFDSASQAFDQVKHIADWVNVCRADAPTLVHCQAGLNRSSLVAATALILSGQRARDVIGLLRQKRSPAVLCNPSFERWLRKLSAETWGPE